MTDPNPAPAFAGPASPAGRSTPRPRRLRLFRAGGEQGPISEINTTPLIDVMLVLLIMFIITIPVASHKVPLDLPRPAPAPPEQRSFHRLDIAADGSLFWNGAALPREQLPARLMGIAADPAAPELRLNAASEARYERIDQILAQIRLAGVQRLGFIGNERYFRAF
jgi:biopolymer transport protein ExbD